MLNEVNDHSPAVGTDAARCNNWWHGLKVVVRQIWAGKSFSGGYLLSVLRTNLTFILGCSDHGTETAGSVHDSPTRKSAPNQDCWHLIGRPPSDADTHVEKHLCS